MNGKIISTGYAITSLFQEVYFPNEEGKYKTYVRIQIKRKVALNLLNAGAGYTRFDRLLAFKTNRVSTVRIHQWLARWQDKEKIVITPEEFKQKIGLEGKYNSFKDLKQKVIGPAYKTLKEESDLFFEFSVEKNKTIFISHLRFCTKKW